MKSNDYSISQISNPAVLSIHVEEIRELAKQLKPDISNHELQHTPFYLAGACARSHVFVVMHWTTGRLVGYAILVPIYKALGFEGHIEDVIIDGQHRSHGLGELLMKSISNHARELQMTSLSLTSNPDNPERQNARALYLKLGFEDRAGLMRLKL